MKTPRRSAPHEPVRVLVIDDDTQLSQAILDALGARGIFAWAVRPTASTSVAEVARTAVIFRPDVVLLDIVMPVDAARVAGALRECSELSRTVFLGCSGHSALADAVAEHLDGFLHKPFDTAELLTAISEASRIRTAGSIRKATPRRAAARHSRPVRRPKDRLT